MTTLRKRPVIAAGLGLGALGFMMVAQLGGATHPRPLSASPLRVSLVPAYEECTSPNRTHGPPLAFPSCNPPVQTSKFLTVGTADSNGADAKSVGHFTFKVRPQGSPNIVIGASISDVRCRPGASPCGSANAADGPDYTGELQVDSTIRISDHFNAVDPGGGNDPATVVDIGNPVNLTCASTADTSIGSSCNIQSGPLEPAGPAGSIPCPPSGCSSVRNGDRTVVGITQIKVFDGGADGFMGTTDNTLFMEQGVFIP